MWEIRKHALSESDLIGIWQYGLRNGAQQADKYFDELGKNIAALAEHPELGSKRDYVRRMDRRDFRSRGIRSQCDQSNLAFCSSVNWYWKKP